MFTGIIEELGTVAAVETRAAGSRLTVRCATVMEDLREGASIAVNGVCLTAVNLRPDSFAADLAPETLRRSNLGDLRVGSRVNLERPLSPSGRLSGHIVQGHVDGTGEFVSLDALGDENWWLRIRVPTELDAFLAELPPAQSYSVELRTPSYFVPEYFVRSIVFGPSRIVRSLGKRK